MSAERDAVIALLGLDPHEVETVVVHRDNSGVSLSWESHRSLTQAEVRTLGDLIEEQAHR